MFLVFLHFLDVVVDLVHTSTPSVNRLVVAICYFLIIEAVKVSKITVEPEIGFCSIFIGIRSSKWIKVVVVVVSIIAVSFRCEFTCKRVSVVLECKLVEVVCQLDLFFWFENKFLSGISNKQLNVVYLWKQQPVFLRLGMDQKLRMDPHSDSSWKDPRWSHLLALMPCWRSSVEWAAEPSQLESLEEFQEQPERFETNRNTSSNYNVPRLVGREKPVHIFVSI